MHVLVVQELETIPTMVSESGCTLVSMHGVVSGVNRVLSGANGVIEGSLSQNLTDNLTGNLSSPSIASSFLAESSSCVLTQQSSSSLLPSSSSKGLQLPPGAMEQSGVRMPPIHEASFPKVPSTSTSTAQIPTVRSAGAKNGVINGVKNGENSCEIGNETTSFLGESSMQSSAWTISGGADVHGAVDSHFCESAMLASAPLNTPDSRSDVRRHGA